MTFNNTNSIEFTAAMTALRTLYEAHGLSALRDVKSHALPEMIRKVASLEKLGDEMSGKIATTEASSTKSLKQAFTFLKRNRREAGWAAKKAAKAAQPKRVRGRPADPAKKAEKELAALLRKTERERKSDLAALKKAYGYFKRIRREAAWAAKKAEKAAKPKGKPGRKPKKVVEVDAVPAREE